jgi:protease YdgD
MPVAFGDPSVFLSDDGKDHRQPMTMSTSPWSSIGKVSFQAWSPEKKKMMLHLCTGALVGKRLMLTAAHCVVDGGTIFQVNYKLNYNSGNFTDEANSVSATVGTLTPENDYEGDWAIVLLDNDLGSAHGYFGFAQPSKIILPFPVVFAGYSNDFYGGEVAGIDQCQIKTKFSNSYGHNCSMTPGASGGPLFYIENGHYYIVGVNTKEHPKALSESYTPLNSNLSTWPDKLFSTLSSLRAKYP